MTYKQASALGSAAYKLASELKTLSQRRLENITVATTDDYFLDGNLGRLSRRAKDLAIRIGDLTGLGLPAVRVNRKGHVVEEFPPL